MGSVAEQLVEEARRGLGAQYSSLRFADAAQVEDAEARRASLLAALGADVHRSCWETKLRWGPLSPGCVSCAAGRWSCLFLNAVCDGGCFFCPGGGFVGGEPGVPVAEGLSFETPRSYAGYVAGLGYRGASFSGGEPLLTMGRVLEFLASLQALSSGGRRRPYTWLYTNGRGASPQRLARLAAAGLDELRFNVAGEAYELSAVRRAVGVIPRVTVEIPVIPEDASRLRQLLPELARLGVDHLNLHELMALGRSPAALAARGYTFLHGPHPPVLGSELLALELLEQAERSRLSLGVHYCSGSFKRACHAWAPRARAAELTAGPLDSLTRWGTLRTLWVPTSPDQAQRLGQALRSAGHSPQRWSYDPAQERLDVHPAALSHPPLAAAGPQLQYLQPFLLTDAEARLAAGLPGLRAVRPAAGPAAAVLWQPASPPLALDPAAARALAALVGPGPSPEVDSGGRDRWSVSPGQRPPALAALDSWERLEPGLVPYC